MSIERVEEEKTIQLWRRFFRGLKRREEMDGAARIEIDNQLLLALEQLIQVVRPTLPLVSPSEMPYPRAIANAFAAAVLSQPLLSLVRDFPSIGIGIASIPIQAFPDPRVVDLDLLGEILGLARWELEDLREEIDLRFGLAYKRLQALQVLWSQFEIPGLGSISLYKRLFPNAPEFKRVDILLHGSQLYFVIDCEEHLSPELFYLNWLDSSDKTWIFHSRYADIDLKRLVARGMGVDLEEVQQLLDNAIHVLPHHQAQQLIMYDRWKIHGYAAITGIPYSTIGLEDITCPLEPSEVDTSAWLRIADHTATLHELRSGFDIWFFPRVNELLRKIYAWIFTQQLAEAQEKPTPADLRILDIDSHLQRTMKPLFDWAVSHQTIHHLALRYDTSAEIVATALGDASSLWRQHVDTAWLGGPVADQPRSVSWLIVNHLIAFQDTIRTALHKIEGTERETFLLFAAFLYTENPLERIIGEASKKQAAFEALTRHFWSVHLRLKEEEDDTTQEILIPRITSNDTPAPGSPRGEPK